ncbi:MAG: DUF3010 family protein [Desulfobacterales bacterium]|nr:DUF3010 family protein [Desulfobacterales bacterium]
MRIIGLEFDSKKMNYVVLQRTEYGYEILNANRVILLETRGRGALIAFQDAVKALYNSAKPDFIGIKSKPETGRLRAGAASMKMEGIALANAPCDVDFVSGKRVNQSDAADNNYFGYLQPALKTAHAVLTTVGNK